MTLVAAMSAVCPSSEVDELTVSLLTIFEHRGLSFELLEVLIKQEIEETGETTVLSVHPYKHVTDHACFVKKKTTNPRFFGGPV